jgi:hypothetical protein
VVPLASLWLPILLSAVFAFLASFVLHMLLPFHRGDMKKVPREDDLLEAMRRLDIAPGDYAAPYAGGPEAMKDPAFVDKMKKGPQVLMTVAAGAPPSMTRELAQWFVYLVVVSVVAAYVAGRALGPGAEYLDVFRFAGTTAFASYALGLPQDSIWYRKNWAATARSMIDGLVYALLTAGVFGWLWPR